MWIFLWLTWRVSSQQIIYLNTSVCNTTTSDCMAPNMYSTYLALDLLWDIPDIPMTTKTIPYFTLERNQMTEILLQVPSFALRCFVISFSIMNLSNGSQVSAEVSPPVDLMDIVDQCQLASSDLFWGSILRIVLSPDPRANGMFQDSICTVFFLSPVHLLPTCLLLLLACTIPNLPMPLRSVYSSV